MKASEKLVSLMRLSEGQAVLIHNPSNMFYLTEGYTGEGAVFISPRRTVIVTDFRYTEQAEKQAPGCEVVMDDNQHPENRCVAALAAEENIRELYFEAGYLSVSRFGGLKEEVEKACGSVSWIELEKQPEKLRQIKTPAEVAAMRKAADITSEAFRQILPKIREGMTEKELRIELDFTMLRLGASGQAFNTIIASGENGSLCHAIPGPRKIRRGDMITMDFGAKVDGYCSDMTRTVALGEPGEKMRAIYRTVLETQKMCEAALAPGKECVAIDRMARDYIDAQGYAGRFGHGLGHSVGIDIHEEPNLNQKSTARLEPGIVITVEPGVYIPGVGGVRVENTCLVTENGSEPLTTADKELIIL